jgi:hypothetical protein
VVFSSQKIKKQKLVGVPSSVRMKFNRKTNRYNSMDGYDYLDGSIEQKQLPIIKEVDYYNPDKFHTTGQNDFEDKKAPF